MTALELAALACAAMGLVLADAVAEVAPTHRLRRPAAALAVVLLLAAITLIAVHFPWPTSGNPAPAAALGAIGR
jgi:hypothetical protein